MLVFRDGPSISVFFLRANESLGFLKLKALSYSLPVDVLSV